MENATGLDWRENTFQYATHVLRHDGEMAFGVEEAPANFYSASSPALRVVPSQHGTGYCADSSNRRQVPADGSQHYSGRGVR